LPGIKKLIPESFRKYQLFEKNYSLDAVPVITVQLRFDGWVTDLNDLTRAKDVSGDQSDGKGAGLDNLLYSPDADYSRLTDRSVSVIGPPYNIRS
jgi:zeta-carotene desaturase